MGIYLYKDFAYTEGVPPDITSVEEKSMPEYSLKWSKYIYSAWTLDQTSITAAIQDKTEWLRKYADGKQEWTQYKRKFEPTETSGTIPISSTLTNINDDGEGGTYMESVKQSKGHTMAVDYTKIFSPAPKYMAALIGMFMQSHHDISVTALDRYSIDERMEKKWALWVESRSKKDFDVIDQKLGLPPQEQTDILPQSLPELNLYESIKGFKLRYDVAMEDALIHTEDISDLTEVMKKVIFDLAVTGYACTYSYKDRDTHKIKYKYTDLCDTIIEYSESEGHTNSRYGAVIEYHTISELGKVLPDVPEEEWNNLARNYVGMFGNPRETIYNESSYNYYSYRIPVLKSSWKTVDYLKKKRQVPINGKVKPYELAKGKVKKFGEDFIKEVDIDAGSVNAIYECKWVIGTDYVFDHGRIEDDCGELPIQCYKIRGASIMEQMVPILDQLQMTFLRLQNAIAKSPPPGLLIDVAGLKGFSMGNSKWRPSDLISIRTATGNMLYDSSLRKGIMPNDKVDSRKVIEQLPGGMGGAINEFLLSFEMGFNHIAELTGLTRESFASQVDPNQTATATKILAAGTSNTLQPLYSGWIHIRRGLAQTAAHRIQIICMRKDIPEDKGYVPVIGEEGVRAIGDLGKKVPASFGIEISPAMTQDERNELIRHVQEAELKGYIEPDVGMFITSDVRRGLSLNKAQAYLSYRIQLAKQQATASAQEAQLIDRQTQMEVATMKTQNDMELEKAKSEFRTNEINVSKDWDYRIKQLDVQSREREYAMKATSMN